MSEKTASCAADRALTGRWILGFGIEAIFTVKDAVFTVRGEIPNLQSDSETDFILVLTLMDSQMTADAQDLLITLDSKLLFSSAFGCTSPDIQDQLGQDYDTRGVVSAQLVMYRNAGGSMFLQRLSMAFATGFDWSSLDNIILKRVECTAMMSRPNNDPKTEWNYQLEIASAFTIKDSDVVARTVFDVAAFTTIMVGFRVTSKMRISVFDILDAVAQGSKDAASKDLASQLSSNLIYISTSVGRQALLLEARLSLGNVSGSWILNSVASLCGVPVPSGCRPSRSCSRRCFSPTWASTSGRSR
jgi:hypothetical protein